MEYTRILKHRVEFNLHFLHSAPQFMSIFFSFFLFMDNQVVI